METSDNQNQNGNLPESQPPAPQKPTSGLKVRTLTACVLAVVYFSVLSLTIGLDWRYVYDAFVLLLTILASLECARAFSNKYTPPIRAFVVLNVILGYSAFYAVHYWKGSGGISAYFSVLVLMLLGCIGYNMFSRRSSMNNVLTTMLVLIYPTTIFVYVLALNYLPDSGYGYGASNSAILMLFMLPAFSDTGAYILGSLLKGPKLAPHISPKKTISGAVGGGIGGMLAGALVLLCSLPTGSPIARLSENMGWNIAHYLIIGAIGSLFVLVGDLIASYIKRQCDVKDFGKLLPGHGGVLDRMDSNIMAGIFLYVYYLIVFI